MHDNCGGGHPPSRPAGRWNAVLNRVTERMDMAWDNRVVNRVPCRVGPYSLRAIRVEHSQFQSQNPSAD